MAQSSLIDPQAENFNSSTEASHFSCFCSVKLRDRRNAVDLAIKPPLDQSQKATIQMLQE